MKKYICAVFALIIALLSGCASGAKRIESGGEESITSVDKINVADFNIAADKLLQSMMESGVFDEFPQTPIIMKVGRIKNSTTDIINMSMLTSRITSTLNRSKIVRVIAEDQISKELAKYNAMLKDGQPPIPQIVLTGEIIEDKTNEGRVKETTYTFIMRLNFDGLSAWEDQTPITKQRTRAVIGL